MILTTTNNIEGYQIIDYLGIVTGVSIYKGKLSMGFSISKYYNSIQDSVDTVKEEAFKKLQENAQNLKANAIVGIKVEIEVLTSNYTMVSVTGTAVQLKL